MTASLTQPSSAVPTAMTVPSAIPSLAIPVGKRSVPLPKALRRPGNAPKAFYTWYNNVKDGGLARERVAWVAYTFAYVTHNNDALRAFFGLKNDEPLQLCDTLPGSVHTQTDAAV